MRVLKNSHFSIHQRICIRGAPGQGGDQISDAILDAYLEQDPNSRVGLEALCTKDHIVLAGEVRSGSVLDKHQLTELARESTETSGTTFRASAGARSRSRCWSTASPRISRAAWTPESARVKSLATRVSPGLRFASGHLEVDVAFRPVIDWSRCRHLVMHEVEVAKLWAPLGESAGERVG